MNKSLLFYATIALLLLSGCSGKKGGTTAKFKLKIAALTGTVNGIAISDGILYGKSDTGASFGHIIGTSSESLVLPNGNWTFHAFIWDASTANGTGAMNGNVYCASSTAALNGSDINLALNLTNANCTSAEFSSGRTYSDAQGTPMNRFAHFFFEECDELTTTPGYTCGKKNQGSSLSYKVVFQEYTSGFAPATGGVIQSNCFEASSTTNQMFDLNSNGLPVNFPSGNGFGVSIKMYPNNTCTEPDPKGIRIVNFPGGIGVSNGANDRFLASTTTCTNIVTNGGTPAEIEQCTELFGSYSASCSGVPAIVNRFATSCQSGTTAVTTSIKHIVAPSTSGELCAPYIGSSTAIGSHPFAGGDGSPYRPYKICTEWQINQIGENTTSASYETNSYKLMNDLDMNKTDIIGPYSKPSCIGVVGALVKDHHNLNSLDQLTAGDCGTEDANSGGFTGTFNGNNKTIRNARIIADSVDGVGLVRKLSGSGSIVDLKFVNLEVSGRRHVGGIAGFTSGAVTIKNINIDNLDIEGRSNAGVDGDFIGGITSTTDIGSATVAEVHVKRGRIRGRDMIGGLVGVHYGKIINSNFSGILTSHESSAGSLMGGIVANNVSGANIQDSFSEGIMDSNQNYIGGIAAQSMGTISNVYSTMVMLSHYPNSGVYVGGLIGFQNTGGTLNDAYYDGVIKHTGGGAPLIGGIVGSNSGTTTACFVVHGTPGGTCTGVSYADIRSVATAPVNLSGASWARASGSLPRLAWQQHECLLSANQLSVATQVSTNGRGGSAANPVIICNESQLSALSARSGSEYYRLGSDINLSPWLYSNLLTTFNGILDGNNKILLGLNLTLAIGDGAASYEGIIKNVSSTGKIGNLILAGNNLFNTAGTDDSATGLLVGMNSGILSGIQMYDNDVHGITNIGQLAGKNVNRITNASIEGGLVEGKVSVGGIAGLAFTGSIIDRVEVYAKIINFVGDGYFNTFGGIAGTNYGAIDQANFGGMINIYPSTSSTALVVGGIAATNNGSGMITNTMTDNYSTITVANTQRIGGLLGENLGTLNRSFALGKVIYENAGGIATGSEPFHPVIGFTSGGTYADVTYLENNIGSQRTTASVSTCIGSNPYTCTMGSAPLGDLFTTSYGGGNGLSTLIPMTFAGNDITYSGATAQTYAASTMLNFYSAYSVGVPLLNRTTTQMSTMTNYCTAWTGTVGNEVCSSGFDIVSETVGQNRMYAYYLAILNETAIPSNAPVWEFDDQEGARLIQLNH